MQVDTGQFRALRDQVAELAAEVAELREASVFSLAFGHVIRDQGYREGRASVLGRKADPRPPRPRHLQVMDGGQQ
jgi:hypothetical protein